MRVILLNDTDDWYHWGCTATSRAVRKRLIQAHGSLTALPIYATRSLHELPTVPGQFDDRGFFRRFSAANRRVFELLARHDRIVINGEGSIHDLSRTSVGLLYLAFACKRFLGRETWVINHSVYPQAVAVDATGFAEAVYPKVYESLDHVAIRECISHETMRALGIDARLSFDCLPITVSELVPGPVEKYREVVIADGVNMPAEVVPVLARAIGHWQARGCSVTVLTGAKANPAPETGRFVQALAPHVNAVAVDRAQSLEQWLGKIAGAALLISGRFHHSIAAAFTRTPFVVFESNTPKNAALCRELGLAPPLSYDDPTLAESLVERSERALAGSPVAEEILTGLLRRAESNFNDTAGPGESISVSD